ncbi:MAG TPA: DegQ family serine endoprotease [Stellaceae bacterium]|nr:DegQ family serine endoprotease [Stellaceae bacterium]
MNEPAAGRTRLIWLTRGRAAALGLGLGASLALSPLVWAESAASSKLPAAAGAAASRPAAVPAALIQQESFAPLVKQVLPAVVNISVTQKSGSAAVSGGNMVPFPDVPNSPFNEFMRRFFDQQGRGGGRHFFEFPGPQAKRIALGSGFIVDPKGYVVTNNHVVGDAARVQVILQDGHKYRAKIIGRDPKTDLAVVKIDAGKPLPYVPFGDSGAAQIGDWVMAVGNPFGLGGTVTTGIISARGRNIDSGPFDDFLQIDAPINRGNSGGPTFNLQGQVIGINTAIYSPNGGSVGIGFAIPSNEAKTIVAQLIEHGTIKRGWLGVQIQQVTPAIAASLGLARGHGALIAVVKPGSPGAKAGLKQGDVILSFNGHDIVRLRDLPRYVAEASPHSGASMTVWRDGKKLEMQATVGNLANNEQVASAGGGEAEQAPTAASALGMHFAALTDRVRQELGVGKQVRGVVITRVDNGSVADNDGLASGDIVVAINQTPVGTPEEAAQELQKIAKSTKKSALLLLNRHGVTEYVGVTVGKNEG